MEAGKPAMDLSGACLEWRARPYKKWVHKFASELTEPEIDTDIEEVQIDEMWHFITNKKTKNMGLASLTL